MKRNRRRSRPRGLEFMLAAAALLGAAAVSVTAAEHPAIVEVQLRNLSDRALKDVPLTFGQVFRKGDLPKSQGVSCTANGAWAASEVKRRYDDGSARFAVVSMILPELPPAGTKTLVLRAGPMPPGTRPSPVALDDLLKTDFDATVTLRFPDGSARSASARKMLQQAGREARTWLHNHVASEWLVSGAPTDDEGQPDPDLNVRFQVRAYANCKRVRVSVVVENCWDHWAGNIRYDVQVRVGGQEVFSQKAVDHRRLSRWRKVFWWGGQAPPVHVAHDLAYLSSSGALPHYDTTLQPPRQRGWEYRLWQREKARWQPMGRGSLTAYMPTTGGRPEIAPYPEWAVRALLTKHPEETKLLLANGDLAGSWPIHVRSRKTGRVLTIDDRPTFWLDYRGPDKPTWQPDRTPPADPKGSRLSPDRAHQPSLAYVPYLLTGDYYYLQEAYFWGSYCLLSSWPHPRKNATGILAGQIRGNAWSLRNIADAGFIAAEEDPEARHFAEKIGNNLAHMTQRMYGPPEYNKIGAWGIRTTESARIQNPANPGWMILAPWENDYLIWSLHHLVELGYAEAARPRDFMLRLRVGALTNAPDFDPLLAAPYRFVVGERGPDKKVLFYEDWKTLGTENARLSKPGLGSAGNGYSYSARAAVVCGVDGGFAGAEKALKAIEQRLPKMREVMARTPSWAILPGGGAARRR